MIEASDSVHMENWGCESVSMSRKLKYQNSKEFWYEHVRHITMILYSMNMFIDKFSAYKWDMRCINMKLKNRMTCIIILV